jgi:hypothetical protein
MLAIRGVWIRLLLLEPPRFLLLQIGALWSEFHCSFVVVFFPLNVSGAKACSAKSQRFLEALLFLLRTTSAVELLLSVHQFKNLDLDAL